MKRFSIRAPANPSCVLKRLTANNTYYTRLQSFGNTYLKIKQKVSSNLISGQRILPMWDSFILAMIQPSNYCCQRDFVLLYGVISQTAMKRTIIGNRWVVLVAISPRMVNLQLCLPNKFAIYYICIIFCIFLESLLALWNRPTNMGIQSSICTTFVHVPIGTHSAGKGLSLFVGTQSCAGFLLHTMPSVCGLCIIWSVLL